jgi:hypothetical protein
MVSCPALSSDALIGFAVTFVPGHGGGRLLALLATPITQPERAFTREEPLRTISGPDGYGRSRTLDSYMPPDYAGSCKSATSSPYRAAGESDTDSPDDGGCVAAGRGHCRTPSGRAVHAANGPHPAGVTGRIWGPKKPRADRLPARPISA